MNYKPELIVFYSNGEKQLRTNISVKKFNEIRSDLEKIFVIKERSYQG